VIDWLDTSHPSGSAPAGMTLVSISAVHPDPGSLRPALEALGIEVTVAEGPEPALAGTLDTPRGRVELH
jgi:hypothetical protein